MAKTPPPSPKQQAPASPKAGKRRLSLEVVPFLVTGQLFLAVLQIVLLVVFAQKPSPPASAPADVPDGLAALRAEVAGLRTDPGRSRLEEQLGQVRKELAELRRQLPAGGAVAKQPAGALCPQLDVMVLALNSRNLTLADYKDTFRGLFADYARERPFWDPAGNYRLGFYVAQTEQVDGRVPFDDPTIRLTSFNIGAPGNHITERLSAIGPRVLEKFSKDRPNRRCLVVASTQCPPPEVTDPGWKELPAVDAVLISRAGQPPSTEFVGRWRSFCRTKKGEVALLESARDASGPDRAAVLELRLKLRSLAHPSRVAAPVPNK